MGALRENSGQVRVVLSIGSTGKEGGIPVDTSGKSRILMFLSMQETRP